jgi:vancomycin aglycone glucosyltransferase
MRALLSTIGSRGDVQPLLALALEVKALGYDVRLCVPPDFREWIEGYGIEMTPIGPEVRPTAKSPTTQPAPAERRRSLAEESVATQFETITAAARDCDVILGATALQIAAPSVAEIMGIPYVFAAYSPNVLPSIHHAPPQLPPMPGHPALPATADNRELWARDAERFGDLFGSVLNAHRTARGLTAVSDVRGHVFTERSWLAADSTLAPWPDPADSSVFQTGAWVMADERPLPRELATFLDAGEPPVYFGFGSTRAPQDLSQVMIQTARGLGRRAIVSRGWADLSLIDREPDCFVVDEVNVQALFRRVAAVVHHGGAGTTTIAALAGAAQVVIPQWYDQPYFARRVDDLGIGVAHATGAPTTESLTCALGQALQADVAARARTVGAAMRRDGARVAAQALADLPSLQR